MAGEEMGAKVAKPLFERYINNELFVYVGSGKDFDVWYFAPDQSVHWVEKNSVFIYNIKHFRFPWAAQLHNDLRLTLLMVHEMSREDR